MLLSIKQKIGIPFCLAVRNSILVIDFPVSIVLPYLLPTTNTKISAFSFTFFKQFSMVFSSVEIGKLLYSDNTGL
ncbi:hypothetical protein ELAN111203_15840 [Elizabethkingia anophelis]